MVKQDVVPAFNVSIVLEETATRLSMEREPGSYAAMELELGRVFVELQRSSDKQRKRDLTAALSGLLRR